MVLIVLDTNVFVGACLGTGASCRLVEACLAQRFRPLMGAALLAEYEDVLGRSPLFAKSRLSPAERSELLQKIRDEFAVLLDDLAQPPNYNAPGRHLLINEALDAIQKRRIDPRVPKVLMQFPKSYEKAIRLARDLEYRVEVTSALCWLSKLSMICFFSPDIFSTSTA